MKKAEYVLFWITSNRGTNGKSIFKLSNSFLKLNPKEKKSALQSWLKLWCSGFGAWTHGDNIVNYGHKAIKPITNRKKLEKEWHLICEKKRKIEDNWKLMSEMFNIRELK